jgi:crossover junction endodeoxyribonuclease RuvC
VILLTIAECGIPMTEVGPLQLKSAITGDGKADKKQVQQMLMLMLNLKAAPQPDDAADALALALYGVLQNAIINV